jgi:hypothetical protein
MQVGDLMKIPARAMQANLERVGAAIAAARGGTDEDLPIAGGGTTSRVRDAVLTLRELAGRGEDRVGRFDAAMTLEVERPGQPPFLVISLAGTVTLRARDGWPTRVALRGPIALMGVKNVGRLAIVRELTYAGQPLGPGRSEGPGPPGRTGARAGAARAPAIRGLPSCESVPRGPAGRGVDIGLRVVARRRSNHETLSTARLADGSAVVVSGIEVIPGRRTGPLVREARFLAGLGIPPHQPENWVPVTVGGRWPGQVFLSTAPQRAGVACQLDDPATRRAWSAPAAPRRRRCARTPAPPMGHRRRSTRAAAASAWRLRVE